MIVVDTSVFLAFLADEPEQSIHRDALLKAEARSMSAGNYLEAVIVVEGRRLGSREDLDEWLALRRIEIAPVDLTLAKLAADAFVRFGKGQHPAGLNYGDCFAYALARQLGAPLLYKGNDFGRTDIRSALA